MVNNSIPCSCTRCVRLSFAYYSEKRHLLRTFGFWCGSGSLVIVSREELLAPYRFNLSGNVPKCILSYQFSSELWISFPFVHLLCCSSLHRRQISSDITSSPFSSTATKPSSSKGLAWWLNKSACNPGIHHRVYFTKENTPGRPPVYFGMYLSIPYRAHPWIFDLTIKVSFELL